VRTLHPTRTSWPSTWTNLVLTWDAASSQAVLYVGGSLVESGAYKLKFSLEGQRFRMGDGMIGGFDEVRLYDRVLSGAEVVKLE
jgi:hypothetical protein